MREKAECNERVRIEEDEEEFERRRGERESVC